MDTKLPADEALRSLELFRKAVSGVVLDAERPVRLLCATLLAGGHLLIEDRPGTGKTTLAKAAARALKAEFRRIQFTPDLLPGDITGGLVFLPDRSAMEFRPGPIFADVLLADELNRATPRTQAALLEAMAERQVTVDGQTHALGPHFTVFATVNPVESSGVQRLPEAELDRFLCSFSLGYPSPEAEAALIEDRRSADPLDGVEPVLDLETLGLLKERAKGIAVAPELVRYVAGLLKAVREHDDVRLGASPRAGLGLYRFSQALALLDGQDHVRPEQLQEAALPLLRHRVFLKDSNAGPAEAEFWLSRLLARFPLPR